MLKLNLAEPRADMKQKLSIAFLSLSVLGLLLLTLPVMTGLTTEPRPLRVEEQEVVIAAAQRLEDRLPELSAWVKDLRFGLLQNEFETLVRRRWLSKELVQHTGSLLVFSNRFFDADTASQEQALLGVVVGLHSQTEMESDIARSE
jgi:hypothetical protein